jgi:hypothetical protein
MSKTMDQQLPSPGEAEVKRVVCDWLTVSGYQWTRVQSGNLVIAAGEHKRRCVQCAAPGTADILVVLPPNGYALWVEVKSHKRGSKPNPDQVAFAARMAELGAGYRIVRDLGQMIAYMHEEEANAKVTRPHTAACPRAGEGIVK